ncbi:MAG TPA: hypothetical protein VFR51_01520 [Pyrinomonadaceae bacterium]|nr:hypothetical protein [Pyrinomonadaceae bacterium]
MSETLLNEQPQQRWHPFTRTAFRFAFVYLILFNLPFPLNVFPYVDKIAEPYNWLWNWIVPRVGRAAFNKEVATVFNGSGDRTFDYLLVACLLLIALVITLIWTILDRQRPSYPTLNRWLNIYVRFSLGTAMIGYGAYKVIMSQFGPPTLDRLMQPFGDSSPMGLLWTFMGASEPYTMFVGFAEMIAGILLFPRKTTTLGALMSIGVMSNVVALNFSYDVPVKLYSTHLLAMAVFLALPDARRLANFFFLNRPAECVRVQPLFRRPLLHRGAVVLGSLFLIAIVSLSLYQSYDQRRSFFSQRSPLYGVWEVEEFTVGQATPTASAQAWRRVIFDSPRRIAVQTAADPHQRFMSQLDQEKRTLTLSKREDPSWKTVLTYEEVSPDVITLTGPLEGLEMSARLHRTGERKFLLTDRGFHWINEFPFNR